MKMLSCDLKNWSMFSFLEPEFISKIRMAVVYGNFGNEALIVTTDGMVYGIGNNSCGCLGTGDTHSTLYPIKVDALCNMDIKTFAYGKGPHVLALTELGEVYSWGHNGYNELGNASNPQSFTPCIVKGNLAGKIVVKIACGSHHSVALTNTGEVYTWGHSIYEKPNGKHAIMSRKMTRVLNGKNVVSVSCGDSSSVVVTDNGEVYSWGRNGVGQLGTGNCTNEVHPCRVAALTGVVIKKVACGYMHTLALSDHGVLFVWGANSHGQLGLNTDSNVYSPTKLEFSEMGRVLDIATSHYNHISIAMCINNRIFMWGQCLGQSIKVPVLTSLKCMHDAFALYASPKVMHQPLILHEEVSLIDSLREAFNDPTTSDLTIQVHGKPIYVHKVVLKIRCHYFRTMFQEHWAENDQSIIEHKQFSYDTYKTFLNYLYTDEIDPPPKNPLELLELANVYSESQLKRRCVDIITKEITVTNVAFLYGTSIQYNTKELEERCFKFALNHLTSVVQTANFAKLDESAIKTFLIKIAQAGAFKT